MSRRTLRHKRLEGLFVTCGDDEREKKARSESAVGLGRAMRARPRAPIHCSCAHQRLSINDHVLMARPSKMFRGHAEGSVTKKHRLSMYIVDSGHEKHAGEEREG